MLESTKYEPDMYARRRSVAPSVHWFEDCSSYVSLANHFERMKRKESHDWYQYGRTVHLNRNIYLIEDAHSLLFDTGTVNTGNIVGLVEEALDGGTLDYIVGSHPDADHTGNILDVISAFPEATFIGPATGASHELYHFEDATTVSGGDTIDLGDHEVEFLMANAFVDAGISMYMFEKTTGTLFTVDWFAYPHMDNECGQFADELEGPIRDRLKDNAARVYHWIPWTDIDRLTAEIDFIIEEYGPSAIAPAHGPVMRSRGKEQLRMFKSIVEELHEDGPESVFGGDSAEGDKQFH